MALPPDSVEIDSVNTKGAGPARDDSPAHSEIRICESEIRSLMERTGGQPFYAYDAASVCQRVEALKAQLPERVHLHYAVKANPMPELVKLLCTITDGLDVASARELRLALSAGANHRGISFAGPGKSMEDLAEAVEAGIVLIIESATEAKRAAAIAAERGVTARCAIRVNPNFELKSSGMRMGGGSQPFGIDAEQIPALMEDLRGSSLDFIGFHVFAGSQNLRCESLIAAQEKTLELVEELSVLLPNGLRWLNMGGGFGVPYFPGEHELDVGAVAGSLETLFQRYQQLLSETEIVLELGRYLVAHAGVYACTVIDKKVSRGKTFVVTNGGLHHHLAVTGNFGQVIRRNYPVALVTKLSTNSEAGEGGHEVINIVGPLCTPLDVLGEDLNLPTTEVGDFVCVLMSGAYGFSASPHNFLSHPLPQEFLVEGVIEYGDCES